jgi:hypothetical protein
MATVTIQYDARNSALKQLMQLFVTLGGRIIDDKAEAPKHDPEMVAKVRRGQEAFRRGDYKIIKTEDLWK